MYTSSFLRRACISAFLLLLTISAAHAATAEDLMLFQNLYYGTPKKTLLELPGVEELQSNALQGDEILFAGKRWDLAFELDDDTLKSVVISHQGDVLDYYNAVITELTIQKFLILRMDTADGEKDIVAAMHASKEATAKTITDFRQNISNTKEFSCTFIESLQAGIEKKYTDSASSYEFIKKLSRPVRILKVQHDIFNGTSIISIAFGLIGPGKGKK